MKDSEEVPPLPYPAQALQDQGDFGRGEVGGVLDAVNAVPVPSYYSCLAGIKKEVGERVSEDGLSFRLDRRSRGKIDIDKGCFVDFKIQDAATRECFDIFNFQ